MKTLMAGLLIVLISAGSSQPAQQLFYQGQSSNGVATQPVSVSVILYDTSANWAANYPLIPSLVPQFIQDFSGAPTISILQTYTNILTDQIRASGIVTYSGTLIYITPQNKYSWNGSTTSSVGTIGANEMVNDAITAATLPTPTSTAIPGGSVMNNMYVVIMGKNINLTLGTGATCSCFSYHQSNTYGGVYNQVVVIQDPGAGDSDTGTNAVTGSIYGDSTTYLMNNEMNQGLNNGWFSIPIDNVTLEIMTYCNAQFSVLGTVGGNSYTYVTGSPPRYYYLNQALIQLPSNPSAIVCAGTLGITTNGLAPILPH